MAVVAPIVGHIVGMVLDIAVVELFDIAVVKAWVGGIEVVLIFAIAKTLQATIQVGVWDK